MVGTGGREGSAWDTHPKSLLKNGKLLGKLVRNFWVVVGLGEGGRCVCVLGGGGGVVKTLLSQLYLFVVLQ